MTKTCSEWKCENKATVKYAGKVRICRPCYNKACNAQVDERSHYQNRAH